MDDPKLNPVRINMFLESVYPSFALLAAMQLDLFSQLQLEPLDPEKLAVALGVKTRKLQPLLFILVKAGLLNFQDGLFFNGTEAAHFLVRGKPEFLGGRAGLDIGNWKRMLHAAETIRNGMPEAVYDDPNSEEDLFEVFQGLHSGAVADGNRLLDYHDFHQSESLLDVGGGSGGLGITIAKAVPHLKVSILDLPSVIPITEKFIAEANATEQVDVIADDIVKNKLSGSYDVVVARHLVQVLSREEAQVFFNNVSRVINTGGMFYILGYILDDSRLSPSKAVNFNLVFITSTEFGEAYTEREYSGWLTKAGFENFTRHVFENGVSLVAASKD